MFTLLMKIIQLKECLGSTQANLLTASVKCCRLPLKITATHPSDCRNKQVLQRKSMGQDIPEGLKQKYAPYILIKAILHNKHVFEL